jgi:GNAT superfamily N-acetyltransferase
MKELKVLDDTCNINTVADYIYKKQLDIASSCEICPKELFEIKKFINKIIVHLNDFIVVVFCSGLITGVGCFLNEPSDNYLECLGGFFDGESDYIMAINYLRNNYKSYKIDFVYPVENKKIIKWLKNINAMFGKPQLCMEVVFNNFIPSINMKEIKELSLNYYKEYTGIHNDKDRFWTSEKIIKALNIFKPFIAIYEDKIIGYIDITYGKEIMEIYDLLVIDEYRNYGFIEALVNEAVKNVLDSNNKIIVHIDVNDPLEKAYEKFGFIKKEISQTISTVI